MPPVHRLLHITLDTTHRCQERLLQRILEGPLFQGELPQPKDEERNPRSSGNRKRRREAGWRGSCETRYNFSSW